MARGRGDKTEAGDQGPTSAQSGGGPPAAKDKMAVPSFKIGRIIGRKGAKIRELQDRSRAKIDVTDEVDGDDTVVRISGSVEQVDHAKSLISRLIQDRNEMGNSPGKRERGPPQHHQQSYEPSVSFQVPEDKCGLVIGSRGSKIREIQQETGATVDVGSRDTAVDGYITISLTGDQEACDAAEQIIKNLISESQNVEKAEKPPPSEVMEVPIDMTRRIIGPMGATIRDIQERTNTQIEIARRATAVDGAVRLAITGDAEDAAAARQMVQDILEEANSPALIMLIEERLCGLIIGGRGSKIRALQDNTGATIKIDKKSEAKDGKVQVVISGSKDQCAAAQDEISAIISQSRDHQGGGGQERQAPERNVSVWVPESACGMIIGKAGSKVAEIEARTGTRVDVHSKERNADGLCLVTVSGHPDACADARAIIEDIVAAENEDEGDEGQERGSMDIWVDTGSLGKIIGRGGSKIRDMERKYKVKIDVKKDEVEGGETKVVLIGARNDVLDTRDFIYQVIDEPDVPASL